jgi:hypothetical protein
VLGVLRAIGARPAQVAAIVLGEAAAISLVSWVVAALAAWPVGLGLGRLFARLMLHMELDFVFVAPALAAWLVLALAIALGASWLPARRAGRMSIHQAIGRWTSAVELLCSPPSRRYRSMRTLVTACVVLGALFWAVPRYLIPWLDGKQSLSFPWDRDPSQADCSTDALYTENCVKLNLDMDFGGSKKLSDAGYVYLRGTVHNLGDRPLSNVIVRVRRQAGTSGAETAATHRLGPVGAKGTLNVDEMYESIQGEKQYRGDGRSATVSYTYRFSIELDRVVFAY